MRKVSWWDIPLAPIFGLRLGPVSYHLQTYKTKQYLGCLIQVIHFRARLEGTGSLFSSFLPKAHSNSFLI